MRRAFFVPLPNYNNFLSKMEGKRRTKVDASLEGRLHLSPSLERRQIPDAEKIKFTLLRERNLCARLRSRPSSHLTRFARAFFSLFLYKRGKEAVARGSVYSQIESMFVRHGSDFHAKDQLSKLASQIKEVFP